MEMHWVYWSMGATGGTKGKTAGAGGLEIP